jgi:sugar phosphate isomerase/epimerase
VKESGGILVINIENQIRKCSKYHFPVCGDEEAMASLLASVEGASQTLDTGHAHINGEQPLGLFERFRDSVSEIHLCDNDGANDDHLIPGQGTADLRGLFDRIAGTDVLVCLESDPFRYSTDEILRTARSLKRGDFSWPSPRLGDQAGTHGNSS